MYLYYYRSSVRKNLSSKFDRFLAGRSHLDTNHGVNFSTPTSCQPATFVRPLFALSFVFYDKKSSKKHKCDESASIGVIDQVRSANDDPNSLLFPYVERSSLVVECRTRNRESLGSNPPLLPFRRLGIFRSLHRRPCSFSCINEYLAIDSDGNMSDLVLARNCCLARMLPGEAENGVGMNRSVREGKKCEAL